MGLGGERSARVSLRLLQERCNEKCFVHVVVKSQYAGENKSTIELAVRTRYARQMSLVIP